MPHSRNYNEKVEVFSLFNTSNSAPGNTNNKILKKPNSQKISKKPKQNKTKQKSMATSFIP